MAKLIIGGKSKQMYHKLNFKADLKPNLAEEMDWDVLDDKGSVRKGIKGTLSLEGEIPISDFRLQANGLKQILELPAETIGSFKIVVSGNEEDGHEAALNFQIVCVETVAAAIEDYQSNVGFGAAQLKCSRTGDEQGSLPGMEPKKGGRKEAVPMEAR